MSERAEWRRRCVAAEVALARLQQEREGLIAPCMCCREVTQPCQHGCRCSVAPAETQE